MKFGYARVSTKDQNESRQIDALVEWGVEISNIFIDKQSGKNFNREQYQHLLRTLRQDDILVIKSIDRLGRNYAMIRDEFKKIVSKGVHINILEMPILNTDQPVINGLTGQFISDIVLSILGYVAEQERDNIHSRQKEGIDSAKRRGIKFGRPTKLTDQFIKIIPSIEQKALTINQVCVILGITRKTYYTYLNQLKAN